MDPHAARKIQDFLITQPTAFNYFMPKSEKVYGDRYYYTVHWRFGS